MEELRAPAAARLAGVQRAHVPVREPFRLDLTVAVLQRLPTNPVEVWIPAPVRGAGVGGEARGSKVREAGGTLAQRAGAPKAQPPGGRYLRAFETERGPVAWVVREDRARGGLALELHGPAGDPRPWIGRVARALGTEVDVAPFYARARRFPPLARLARAMRGVKPPRFAALHESFASVLLFQQVSLPSALATLRRLVVALAPAVEVGGAVLHPFPSARAIAALSEAELRALGMSGAKARALRAVCAAVAEGRLDEDELAALPSSALHERLLAIEGVGPWTAALLLLRGFGRTDQFPPGDVAAEKLLSELGSDTSGRVLLAALGDARGMLYYHLFLHRLARAEKGPFAPVLTAAAAPAAHPASPPSTRRGTGARSADRAT